MNAFRKYLAEFIGTFVLVLVACGVAIVTGCTIVEKGISTAIPASASARVFINIYL